MKYSELQNRVLRKISENLREELTRGWRNLHKKKLHSLYSSPNITRLSEGTRKGGGGVWNVKTRTKMHTKFWLGNMKEKDHVEDPGIYRRIILNGSERNGIGGCGLGSSGPG